MQRIESYWFKALLIGVLLIIAWKVIDIPIFLSWVLAAIKISTPFIIGAVIAFFTAKPAALLERLIQNKAKSSSLKKLSRLLSVIAVYAVFVAIVAVILNFLIPAVYRNMQDLVASAPAYYNTIQNFIVSIEPLKSFNPLEKINQTVMSYLNFDMMARFAGIISSVANSVVTFFLSIVISIYILIEKEALIDFFKTLIGFFSKSKKAPVFALYGKKIIELFNSYFLGLLLDSVIIGAISTVFLAIFGAPYPWLLGIVVFVGNMIPFFGPIAAAAIEYIASAIVLGPVKAVWVLVFQIVLGQLDGNLLQPKIVGTSVGISPFWVIFAVTFFGGIWGAWGLILGVPIVAALRVVYLDYKDDHILGNSF